MSRPNRKTKAAEDFAVTETTTTTEKVESPVKEVKKAPVVKMVSAYAVNTSTDEETAEKRAWGPNTVNGTMIGIVAALEAEGTPATKEAILAAFEKDEKSSKLVATEWTKTPMKYVEGYLHFLKGNRSLTSTKIEA